MPIVELAPKPSISDEARIDAAKIVDDLKAMSNASDIAEMVAIIKHPNGTWTNRCTATMSYPEMIGRLVITAQAMADKYLQSS